MALEVGCLECHIGITGGMTLVDQVTILSKELEKVKDVFDYCIIDCPPDINISVINALVAADEVIIPIKIDGYAFDGMKELEEQINNAKQLNPKLKFRGCLVTMFYNRDVCRQGEEYLQNQRYPVFRTHPENSKDKLKQVLSTSEYQSLVDGGEDVQFRLRFFDWLF